ncbi:hypothetical protein STRAU_4143 [Streptomyces aurantiacus JA 4570]|uniref:Uncharacterized protein n=1 Tax=Streptomyces aurantiacus JA 4570 TaxID=1286094 RepID=S4AN14_9ACTN|nr:hypothetical protein STRAU_4143 [Streptomyces aurantiacus JA 4570]
MGPGSGRGFAHACHPRRAPKFTSNDKIRTLHKQR